MLFKFQHTPQTKGDFKTKVTPQWVGTGTDTSSSASEPGQDMGGLLRNWAEPAAVQLGGAAHSEGWEVYGTTDAPADCRKAPSSS